MTNQQLHDGKLLLRAIDENAQKLLFLSRARKAIVSDQINLLKSHGITDEAILKDFESKSMELFFIAEVASFGMSDESGKVWMANIQSDVEA